MEEAGIKDGNVPKNKQKALSKTYKVQRWSLPRSLSPALDVCPDGALRLNERLVLFDSNFLQLIAATAEDVPS